MVDSLLNYFYSLSLTDTLVEFFKFFVGTVVMLELFIVMGVIMTTYSDSLVKSGRHFLVALLFLVLLSW